MQPTLRDQEFLDSVYVKARLLEYDKREEEKVRLNKRLLARRRNWKIACSVLLAAIGFTFLRYNGFEQWACLTLSFVAAAAGIAVENAEFVWHAAQAEPFAAKRIGKERGN